MLNREKRQLIMGQILKDIYTNTSLASLLGLKGGTCAYFFYGLPRFSVDLDFDLLNSSTENQKIVFKKIIQILEKYGKVKNKRIKRFTIFALLSYGNDDHNIKIEINLRQIIPNIKQHYKATEYLGILMLIAKKDYLFAGKLIALILRKLTAMRDIYDIHYFAKHNWDIDSQIIKLWTKKGIKEYLIDCISFIEKTSSIQGLQGLGELVDEKEKNWVKSQMKADTIFMLKNYISVYDRRS